MNFSERVGRGATIKLDSGEIVIVSLARSGVLVRLNKGFLGSMFGPALYKEPSMHKVAGTAVILAAEFHEKAASLSPIQNPVLASYSNAIWHSSSAAEVTTIMGRAAWRASVEDVTEIASMLAAFEEAKDWKPTRQSKDYKVTFSDGKTQEQSMLPSDFPKWPIESNKMFESEGRAYRITHIVDDSGKTVWSDGRA